MVKEALVAGITGLALVGCGSEIAAPTSPNIPSVEKALRKVTGYWATQGMGSLSTLKMVTLEGRNDKFVCHGDNKPDTRPHVVRSYNTEDILAEYCAVENTIVLVQHTYEANLKTTGLSPEQSTLKLMAHEVGHAVLNTRNEDPRDGVLNELRAECYGAKAVSQLDPAAIPLILKEVKEHYLDSKTHGTNAQKIDVIQQGADPQGVPCGYYNIPK